MELKHLGHACVLVQTATTRLLFDPGTLAGGFETERELDAILITHQHADHLDLARLPALRAANPRAALFADPGSAVALAKAGYEVVVVEPGQRLEVGGTAIEVVGGTHATVHPDLPTVPNGGFVIDGGAFYHPGDSYWVPDREIDVFAVPTSGPWLKVGEAIDFLRQVAPRIAVPIHEAALADTHTHYSMLTALAPADSRFQPLPRGELVAV